MSDQYSKDEGLADVGAEYALRSLRAGLGYACPADNPKQLFDAIINAQRHRTALTITIPTILLQHFITEGARLGMSEDELIVRILETHRFADEQEQHLVRAIARQKV